MKYKKDSKIAYVHTMQYPSVEANALQAIRMASAFSELRDTTLFVPRQKTSNTKLKQHYDISGSPLRMQSMYLNYLPRRFSYEQYVSLYFRTHPKWTKFRGRKVLFVRVPKELIFWGLLREQQDWLKDWIFVFEAHDVMGVNPSQLKGSNPLSSRDTAGGLSHQRLLQSLLNFDLVLCVTRALADNLKSWSCNAIQPHVVRHASPLTRKPNPPKNHFFGEKISLGYVGTIDRYRGVNIVLDAIRYLPENFKLRLVGRVRQEKGSDPDWLNQYLRDPQICNRIEFIDAVPVQNVAEQIDRCDIVIQPASDDIIDSRYASPLKSYDYMVRGKPIVAADVPSHHELLSENVNACYYHHNDAKHLAAVIQSLVAHPQQAQFIARSNWEQSMDFTYDARASRILGLIDGIRK
jgi:glycosyltransferase involved in cell wall biosynthesis